MFIVFYISSLNSTHLFNAILCFIHINHLKDFFCDVLPPPFQVIFFLRPDYKNK